MPELETIEGHVETRDPETEVLVRRSTRGGDRIYHEVPEGFEPGDNPPCGAHTREQGHTYQKITLKKAISRWAEPCGHAECTEIRTAGSSKEEYKREDVLYDMYWTQKLTLAQIADKFDVEDKTISRWMRRNQIPRTKGGYRDVYNEEPPTKRYRDISEDELETLRLHFDQGISYRTMQAEKVHLPNEEDNPMCDRLGDEETDTMDIEDIPVENICKQCVERWRI